MPATKSFRSGIWASTLLADEQVGPAALGDELVGELRPKNSASV